MRKAIEMMEIRLAGRMRQGPIGLAAVHVFGDRGEAETPPDVPRQARKFIQAQRGLQCVALRRRLPLDAGRADLRRDTHPASVAAEPIGGPRGRGREVELVVRGARSGADECLEAGLLPKLMAARRRGHGRQAQLADVAVEDVGQQQTAGAWSRNVHVDARRRDATRVRMTSQRQAHGVILLIAS